MARSPGTKPGPRVSLGRSGATRPRCRTPVMRPKPVRRFPYFFLPLQLKVPTSQKQPNLAKYFSFKFRLPSIEDSCHVTSRSVSKFSGVVTFNIRKPFGLLLRAVVGTFTAIEMTLGRENLKRRALTRGQRIFNKADFTLLSDTAPGETKEFDGRSARNEARRHSRRRRPHATASRAHRKMQTTLHSFPVRPPFFLLFTFAVNGARCLVSWR